jgi:hypothetical protein
MQADFSTAIFSIVSALLLANKIQIHKLGVLQYVVEEEMQQKSVLNYILMLGCCAVLKPAMSSDYNNLGYDISNIRGTKRAMTLVAHLCSGKAQSPEISYEYIESMRNKIDKRLKAQKPNAKVTVFIGNSSAGKSTIYNYVQGVPLVAIRDHNGELAIDKKNRSLSSRDIDAEENGGIGHGTSSKTSYPSISEDGHYIDCPGFEDTHGIGQDIINASSLQMLFSNPKIEEMKIVLVVARDIDLSGRCDGFVKLIRHLGKMFSDQASKLQPCLSLIVTKSIGSDSQVIEIIRNRILEVPKTHTGLTVFEKRMCEFLGKKGSPINLFPIPNQEGEEISSNLALITGSRYIPKLAAKITLSPESENALLRYGNELTKKTATLLAKFESNLRSYAEQLIRKRAESLVTAKPLRQEFKQLQESLGTVCAAKGDNFDGNVETLKGVLAAFDPSLAEEFLRLIAGRRWLLSIKPENLSLDLALNVNGNLTKSQTYLLPFSNDPMSVPGDSGSYTLWGRIIGTSDLSSIPLSETARTLRMYGGHTLLVDSNFKSPGTNVVFAAPTWRVLGEKSINLQGNQGDHHNPDLASDGNPGLPGRPGKNGGNFYGIQQEYFSTSKGRLTIDVSGGKGGKGQAGGHGRKGSDGEEGTEAELESKARVEGKPQTISRGILRWPFTAVDAQEVTVTSGNQHKRGVTQVLVVKVVTGAMQGQ